MNKNCIGFSTGILYGLDLTLDQKIDQLSQKWANAIELGFGKFEEFPEYNLGEETKDKLLQNFSSISLHAPWKGITYGDNSETKQILANLEKRTKELAISGIVIHPDTVENFGILDTSCLPFCIENMDLRKSFGTHPEHFQELIDRYKFWLVLDVQHAYEQDPSMNLAKEFIITMGDRLKHMHVSWCSALQGHVPTYKADNQQAIAGILAMKIPVPKILEGVFVEVNEDNLHQELDYVASFE